MNLETLVIHLATLYDMGEPCVDFDGNLVEDSSYDEMVRQLRTEKPSSKAFDSTSPSTYEAVGRPLITHRVPMTSIAKADGTPAEKLAIYNSWIADCTERLGHTPELVCSYKRDGVAVSIVYKDGQLVEAGLRPRDGIHGIDVTPNIRFVAGVPAVLLQPFSLTIRGELECTHDDFACVQARLEQEGGDLRANPRNHTSGAINRQTNPEKTADALISFTAYGVVDFDRAAEFYTTRRNMLFWIYETLGIPSVYPRDVQLDVMEKGVADLNFEVDGVVIAVNNLEDYEQLGHHGDNLISEPRGAIAWKFEEERAVAVVDHIEWNTSRTGRVTPVAVFRTAVSLAGTQVQRATCSNLGWLSRMKIGQGTVVKVYKAGKIIPKIEEVVADAVGFISAPTFCPTCEACLIHEDGHGDNQELICPNLQCLARQIESMAFYLKTMGAKGLGSKKIERIIASGKIKSLPDIYNLVVRDLTESGFTFREALLAVSTVQMVKPSKDDHELLLNIMASRTRRKIVAGWQFFAALGIDGAGKTVGKLLFDHLKSFTAIREASYDVLVGFDGIGDVTARSIVEYFEANAALVDGLLTHIDPRGMSEGGLLDGKVFCLSGSFEQGKSFWETMITEGGGKVSGGVTKKTTHLVAGPGSGSKTVAANKLIEGGSNLVIISENELHSLLQGN